MAGGYSLSPLKTMGGDTLSASLEASVLNAEALKETPSQMTRSGVGVMGTPSAAGTRRFAGQSIAQVFDRADVVQAAGPQLQGFVNRMQGGPFAMAVGGGPSGGPGGGTTAPPNPAAVKKETLT